MIRTFLRFVFRGPDGWRAGWRFLLFFVIAFVVVKTAYWCHRLSLFDVDISDLIKHTSRR